MSALDDKDMFVTKRTGKKEPVSFDKILKRIKKIGTEVGIRTNYTTITMKVIEQLFDGISTRQIDELSASQCASMASIHPDYNILAARLIISNHNKNTPDSFITAVKQLYKFKDKHGKSNPLLSDKFYQDVLANADYLDGLIDYSRDFLIDYFGFKTLDKSYLMKINKKTVERPQHMWMRVAVAIHGTDKEKIAESYYYLSNKYMTHATPTLFNAGTRHQQLSSCFLLAMEEDSIEGIFNTLKDCAMISKWAGGIGLHIHNIRASGSHINGTNGSSNGIVPMLKVFNNTAKYVDQCLDPDTIVYTTDGPKPIKQIGINDMVVCDDGKCYEIGKLLDNLYTGDLYVLDIHDTMVPLKATDMHPLWVVQVPPGQSNHAEIVASLDRHLLEPEFLEIKKISAGDYVGFPIPQYEKDISCYSTDDCIFYGLMLACGSMYHSNGYTSVVLCRSNDQDMMNFVKFYLEKINILIQYKDLSNNQVQLTWTRNNMFFMTYEMIYNSQNCKYIKTSMMHLPLEKTQAIVQTFLRFAGDFEEYYIYHTSYSSHFVENLRYMLLRLGVLCSGKISTQGLNKLYTIKVPYTKSICDMLKLEEAYLIPQDKITYFQYGNCLFSRVREIHCIENYTGRVIDIEVNHPDHHNFLTHNGLVKNGGGKRNGSFAIYLEPWHADIEMFLQMRKNHGDEELKARDLFYALWVPDLFMERVKENGTWTLMCPDECPGLSDVYGDDFVKLYTKYEEEGKGRCTKNARDLWFQILDAQMETGTPYLLYKDACNKKSNQKNLGTIKSSNLCTEIIQYSNESESAVCNLASIALPAFVDTSVSPPVFDFEKLHKVARLTTSNLNRIIDINYYPTEKTRKSNMLHRPIGIGIQGLADVFLMMNYSFASDQARTLNRNIFETMYHGALEESCEISKVEGPYSTFPGSPASQGILQFDMWEGVVVDSTRYNWDDLKEQIKTHGIRNSLLLAPMPTASTSQILGYNECIEPITSNIYSRRTMAGEFVLTNKYLLTELIGLNLWNEKIKNNIIANNGSIQQIDVIPAEIREKYKTVWELPMKALIDMAADRGAFICQSQSLNLWVEDPTYNRLTSMHFYSWSQGLKTGIYYLRRRAKHQAQQFTIVPEKANHVIEEDDEICEMCSA
jgi:ribonucleoside-diphosphate reductase alpha subunit